MRALAHQSCHDKSATSPVTVLVHSCHHLELVVPHALVCGAQPVRVAPKPLVHLPFSPALVSASCFASYMKYYGTTHHCGVMDGRSCVRRSMRKEEEEV